MEPKKPSRISRITGKVIGTLSDAISYKDRMVQKDLTTKYRKQTEEVQRQRARRQLQEEYRVKEAKMPKSQRDTMAETMEFNRRKGNVSSGKGVGY